MVQSLKDDCEAFLCCSEIEALPNLNPPLNKTLVQHNPLFSIQVKRKSQLNRFQTNSVIHSDRTKPGLHFNVVLSNLLCNDSIK